MYYKLLSTRGLRKRDYQQKYEPTAPNLHRIYKLGDLETGANIISYYLYYTYCRLQCYKGLLKLAQVQ